MAPDGGGYAALEGCSVGFCVASYEGTREEQAAMQGGEFAIEALVKVRVVFGPRASHTNRSEAHPLNGGTQAVNHGCIARQ